MNNEGGIFSVALSVNETLHLTPRPLAGTLFCEARTFLPQAPLINLRSTKRNLPAIARLMWN